MRRELRAIETKLTCERRVPLYDDLWFWDRAVGLACQAASGDVVRVFVYRTPGSAAASAAEQGVGEGQAVIVDDRLLISGERTLVEAIGEDVERLPAASQHVDDSDLAPEEDDATFCVRAVAAHAMSTVEGDAEPASDISDLDSLYPGYATRVQEVDDEIGRSSLATLQAKDALAFESGVSRLGPATKAMCTTKDGGS